MDDTAQILMRSVTSFHHDGMWITWPYRPGFCAREKSAPACTFKKSLWRNNLISKNYHSMSIYSGNAPATAGTRSIHTSHFAAFFTCVLILSLSLSCFSSLTSLFSLLLCCLRLPVSNWSFQLSAMWKFHNYISVENGNIRQYIYIYIIYTLYIYTVWYTHIFGYLITIGNSSSVRDCIQVETG